MQRLLQQVVSGKVEERTGRTPGNNHSLCKYRVSFSSNMMIIEQLWAGWEIQLLNFQRIVNLLSKLQNKAN